MKKILFLISFCLLGSFSTVAATKQPSKMKLEIINEESSNKSSTDKNKTTTNKKEVVNAKPVTLYTGWQQVPNTNLWVYLINNQMLKGWHYIQGPTPSWYYFNEAYIMVANQWVQDKGKWYYLGADGRMLTNTTTPDGYYVDEHGVWNNKGKTSTNEDGEIINNNKNEGVLDASSKYLYNRVLFKNSKSITTSTKLGNETLKKNIIKMSNDSEISIPNVEKYTKLKFDYIIQSPNVNNEYLLEIWINDELQEELTEFSSSKSSQEITFEKNSTIKFIWKVDTSDGSKTDKAISLYIYNGVLSR